MNKSPETTRGEPTSRIATWVVGSSHVVRWRSYAKSGDSPQNLGADHLIGYGGTPIWSKKTFEQAIALVGEKDCLGLVVPDFRLGNSISLLSEKPVSLFLDGFSSITPNAIGEKQDEAMLERSIDALRFWNKSFGVRARFVFWSLLGNQIYDRLAGRNITDGRYRHPTFSLERIYEALPCLNIVDLTPLLKMPMHEVSRLFIDENSHPSKIGFLTLDGILSQGLGVLDAYRNAVETVESDLFSLAARICAKHGQVILTGRSVWLDTIVCYLGATGSKRLADAGLIIAPLDKKIGQISSREMLEGMHASKFHILIFSTANMDLTGELSRVFSTEIDVWSHVTRVDWESSTLNIILGRNEIPRFSYMQSERGEVPNQPLLVIDDEMVELGQLGAPTWIGLKFILDKIARNDISPVLLGGNRIEGDVLITEQGIAFLIGGNHSVLKFATGEIAPSIESIELFNRNISQRGAFLSGLKLPYTHIIFPDKQSVLSGNFPYQPVHRLGDAYLASMTPSARDYVIYPADNLMLEKNDVFLPLDTHMTDHGSLAVLRIMLQTIGIDAPHTLNHIATRITKNQIWAGDLGNKLSPTLLQHGVILDSDWPIKKLQSPGGFNDGMVDILFSPEAEYKLTVLLFGDSFFRMMLSQLSAVFSRVICLRTRHLHPEMVTLIKPDVVFTGNAERYLSNVVSDRDAHAFFMYPLLRKSSSFGDDEKFLAAWQAITAPDSTYAQSLFAEYGVLRPNKFLKTEA